VDDGRSEKELWKTRRLRVPQLSILDADGSPMHPD
jgi:hypothetical protein